MKAVVSVILPIKCVSILSVVVCKNKFVVSSAWHFRFYIREETIEHRRWWWRRRREGEQSTIEFDFLHSGLVNRLLTMDAVDWIVQNRIKNTAHGLQIHGLISFLPPILTSFFHHFLEIFRKKYIIFFSFALSFIVIDARAHSHDDKWKCFVHKTQYHFFLSIFSSYFCFLLLLSEEINPKHSNFNYHRHIQKVLHK